MSRVKLASINSLTFYKDDLTKSRRTSPIPQLVCVGKPCRAYQPEVVRCENLGGSGLDVDWKCEADLPEALRFGKVMVSCEGWSGPGDPYVLKDSCSLEYRLVELPKNLRNPNTESYDTPGTKSMDVMSLIFTVAWVAILLLICYSFLKSCLQRRETTATGPTRGNRPGGTPGPGGSFPGHYDDRSGEDPPPPYYPKSAPQNSGGWRPGFWTGAAAGGLADWYLFRNRNRSPMEDVRDRPRRQWDWERSRQSMPVFGGGRAWSSSSEDRGEGSSNLGSMRQSTGFGGSSSR